MISILITAPTLSLTIFGEKNNINTSPDSTGGSPAQVAASNVKLSRVRNQQNDDAECWDLLNQRWTQIISEADTGGMVTVMQVDLPNGCKQLAHVHCGLHEAFYKIDNKGDAVWTSANNGNWQEVSPRKGDFSYASMGTGHGYTNADVSSCNGTANVLGYTATSYTSHFVIKMPGFEHESRARTVPSGNRGGETCNMMKNRIGSGELFPGDPGYSNAAKAAIGSYGKTDPKFIPALLTLAEGTTYAPSHADVKPIQYTPHSDETVARPTTEYPHYGHMVSSARRLMSLNSWTTAVDHNGAGTTKTGTGGVAQMDEVRFSGSGSATKVADGKMNVFMVVDGTVMLKTGATSRRIFNLSGFVLKAGHTAPWRIECESSSCTVLELTIGHGFATSFMHDAAYGVPLHTFVEDARAAYVKASWGPSKNTYQRCAAPNDASLAPAYMDFTPTNTTPISSNVPTGSGNRTAVFSCYMSCVSNGSFTDTARTNCRDRFASQTIVHTSTACPDLHDAVDD